MPSGRPVLRSRISVVALVLAVLGAFPAVARAAPVNALTSWRIAKIALPATDAVFLKASNTLLVTVGFDHPVHGNNLVQLDPRTGAVLRSVHVGSSPTTLQVSDDYSTAYVALGGAPDIVEVNLLTFTVTRQFTTGLIEDIVVVPGTTDTIAVVSRGGLVSVWRNGVALPKTLSYPYSSQLIMVDGLLYLGNYKSSDQAFVTLQVDDTGVTQLDYDHVGIGYDMKHAGNGLIATNGGHIVDPTGPTVVRDLGKYGVIEPEPAKDRVSVMEEWGDTNGLLTVFEQSTGRKIASRRFHPIDNPQEMVATGSGFAVIAWSGFYLIGPAAPLVPVPIPSRVPNYVDTLTEVYVPIDVTRMQYDASRGLLYATTDQSSRNHPNRFVALDPYTGAVVKSLDLGGRPFDVALTEDRATAYVSILRASAVAVVDLATFTERSRFAVEGIRRDPLAPPTPPPVDASYIAVRPGTDNTVAIALVDPGYSYSRGMAIYTDGVRVGADWTLGANPNHLAFTDAGSLYATDGVSSSGDLYVYSVDPSGELAFEAEEKFSLADFTVTPDGRAWGSWGLVGDIATQTARGHAYGSGSYDIEPALDRNRIFGADFDGFSEYDATTFRRVGAKRIYGPNWKQEAQITRTGVGLAARGHYGLVLLIPPTCQGLVPTIVGAGSIFGTAGSDVIVGSNGNDLIDGLGGDDVICALGGNDRLVSGNGNDDLDGGAGVDSVTLSPDVVKHYVDLDDVADDGALWTDGRPREADNIRSTNEFIIGSPGPDRIVGTDGRQVLRGGAGTDVLLGGNGDDVLDGGEGADFLDGGAGADACRLLEDDRGDCETVLR